MLPAMAAISAKVSMPGGDALGGSVERMALLKEKTPCYESMIYP